MNLAGILAGLKEKGLKLTPQRQQIVRVLLREKRPLSAKEVRELVNRRFPGVGLGTIYRTLDTLKELGLVNEVVFPDGGKRFELRQEHRHHLICLGCGRVVSFLFCPDDCVMRVAAANPDFEIHGHSFAVFGYCGECRKAKN